MENSQSNSPKKRKEATEATESIGNVKATPKPKLFVAIDIEASGYYSNEHYIIAFGAVMFLQRGDEIEEVDSFMGSMKPPTPAHHFEGACRTEFWENLEKNPGLLKKLVAWEAAAKTPAEIMDAFVAWLQRKDVGQYVWLSDNPEFDIGWINTYLVTYCTDPAHRRPLNALFGRYEPAIHTDVFMFGALGGWSWSPAVEAAKTYGFDKAPKGNHDPVADAREIGLDFIRCATAVNFFETF